MKRYLIPTIIILVLVTGLLLGCDNVPPSEPASTQTPTTTESQAEIEALKEELNRLREQKKTEILQQAEAYYAIVKLLPAKSSGEVKFVTGDEMVEAFAEQLKASSKLWSLIKATEDPYLISIGKPDEWGRIPVRYSHVRNYAEGKYRELMSEYYSQQYIDDQLSMLEQSMEKLPLQKTEEETKGKAVVNPEVEEITPKPKLDITVVIEYEGKWAYQVTTISSWSWVWYGSFSGNKSKVYENIQLPFHCRARKSDEGTASLVVKIIYNGQVVAQDTAIGKDDEAYVFWEGPH